MLTKDRLEVFSHVARKVGPLVQTRIDALSIGQKMQDLPEELWHDSFRFYVKEDPTRRGGPNLRLIRLDPRRPSLTVTAFIYNKFVHHCEDRFITPREAARLQDFPDTFLFKGALTSIQRQVGNAVPARLGLAVAKAILAHAKEHHTLDEYLKGQQPKRIPSLSLFSGVGGLDLGFGVDLAAEVGVSFAPVAHIEFDEDCCRTLSANLGCSIEPTNIRAVASPQLYIRQRAQVESVPIVLGGPPCQAFSQAGLQKADADDRGRMISEFLRFVDDLRPTYFVMENVSNLKGVSGGHLFASTVTRMRALGYAVDPFKLIAADYGTAQFRQRLFFVGVKNEYPPVEAPVKTHGNAEGLQPYRTVGDAFEGLPTLMPDSAAQRKALVTTLTDESLGTLASASRLRPSRSAR